MKRTTPEHQQWLDELAFAESQVQAGNNALANRDIDHDVAERVKRALNYWTGRVNHLLGIGADNGW